MALLLTSVFGVTGCGSDDDVQVESRVKNVAPEASGVSDAPSKGDCDLVDRYNLDLLGVIDLDYLFERRDIAVFFELLNRLESGDFLNQNDRDVRDIYYLLDRDLLDRYNLLDLLDLLDRRDIITIGDLDGRLDFEDFSDLRDRCDAVSDSGVGADDDMSSAPTTLPAVDDDLAASTSVCVDDDEGVKRPFEVAVEQFREDLALFRVAQSGRNDQSLTEEQRQGHRDDYASAYDVKTKSAAAAIQVANERGFNLDSPDNLDESFLSRWDSTICE